MNLKSFVSLSIACLVPALAASGSGDDDLRYRPGDAGRLLVRIEGPEGPRYSFQPCARTVSQGVVCLDSPKAFSDPGTGASEFEGLFVRSSPVDMTFCGRARLVNRYTHDVHETGGATNPDKSGRRGVVRWLECNNDTKGARAMIWWGFPEGTQVTAADPVEEQRLILSLLPSSGPGVDPVPGSKSAP